MDAGRMAPGVQSSEIMTSGPVGAPLARSAARRAPLLQGPAFRQRVQTRTRLVLPATSARMETRFGSHRRRVSLWA
jgi:hypothetical protein